MRSLRSHRSLLLVGPLRRYASVIVMRTGLVRDCRKRAHRSAAAPSVAWSLQEWVRGLCITYAGNRAVFGSPRRRFAFPPRWSFRRLFPTRRENAAHSVQKPPPLRTIFLRLWHNRQHWHTRCVLVVRRSCGSVLTGSFGGLAPTSPRLRLLHGRCPGKGRLLRKDLLRSSWGSIRALGFV